MDPNYLKNPDHRTSQQMAQKQVLDAFYLDGKALPCHVTAVNGALITVVFDVSDIHTLPSITVPLFGPEYIRYPIKATDLGVVMPCDASLSYTSGQGGGISDLSQPGNLEALYFMPVGSKLWVTVDPAQVTLYAPNGVTIRDTASESVIVLHPGTIDATISSTNIHMDNANITLTATNVTVDATTFTVNAPTIVLDGQMTQGTSGGGYPATLQGPLTVIHEVTANGIPLSTHLHGGVQTGSGDTGVPII
jgi:hypothetical protein